MQRAVIQESKQGLYTMTNLSLGVSILKSDYLTSELSGVFRCEASNAQGFSTVSTTVQGMHKTMKKKVLPQFHYFPYSFLSTFPVYKVCEINPCLNGATCIPDKSGKAFCLCSEQNSGDYCENCESMATTLCIGNATY